MTSSDHAFFEVCETETLQDPTELWSIGLERGKCRYHFLRYFESRGSFWYVVIAMDAQDDELEILDSFPTEDSDLIHRLRQGEAKILKAKPSG